MITQIDHVILLVNDLDTATTNARSAGFTVHPGGVHDDQVTHNALIPFADGSYIEIISFVDATPPPNHYFGKRYLQGSGLADVGLLSTDIDLDVQAITDAGLPFPIPTHFGRYRPDGQLVTWRMSLPGHLHPSSGFPFLIQDITDRALRVPSSAADTTHANGAIGIAGVTFVVDNTVTADANLRSILGVPPQSGTEHFRGRGLSVIPIGSDSRQWLALMQPVADSTPQRYMETFGPGPYAVNLQTIAGTQLFPGGGDLMTPELLEGARLYLQAQEANP
jgi:hypothetical protein